MSDQMPQSDGSQQPGQWWSPPVPQSQSRSSHRRRRVVLVGVAAVALAGGAVAVSDALTGAEVVRGTGTLAQTAGPTTVLPRWHNTPEGGTPYGRSDPYGDGNPYGGSANGSGGDSPRSDSGGTTSASRATTAQSAGVVDINTTLAYQGAAAAGTGTIMSPGGEVLTNNHVIDGATSITVTVVSSGATYPATVVGTDATDDVAVLRLSGASGLQRANYATASGVRVGDKVVGVGNAEGAGGTPSAASGTVTALAQSITATDEGGANPERLTGLIETNAPIEPGDSGGPLYGSDGRIIGMDTAASVTGPSAVGEQSGSQTVAGYAIPIEHALTVAARIEAAATSTSTIHVGYPAFLGVSVTDVAPTGTGTAAGAGVEQVVPGGPADKAGIAAGDVITAVGGKKIGSASALGSALAAYRPGAHVSVAWIDQVGQTQRAQLSLARGPAD